MIFAAIDAVMEECDSTPDRVKMARRITIP
jgi:hypothetical protein